jgi:hypothetical protein
MTLSEVAKNYSNHTNDDFGIKGYKVPRKISAKVKDVLKYYPEEESKKKSFMNEIIKHSKEIPDPRKYSKITVWAPKGGMNTKGLIQSKKVTLFSQLSKESKG